MTTTRKSIITTGARRIGGRTGTIASGSTTTAVLNGLVNTTGDDNAYKADRLIMMDAATEADREKLIDTWADLTGTATFATRAVAAANTENYILVAREDYTLAEWRAAVSKALLFSHRTYRQVVPLVPNLTVYPLAQCPWLEGADDIDAVFLSTSPVVIHNEDFSLWENGASAAPDGWTLTEATATVTRVSSGLRSPYAAKLEQLDVGDHATLYQSVPTPLLQWLTRSTGVIFYPWQVGAWVTSATANIARVGVYNGSTTTWSPYHTGNSIPQWLTPTTPYTPTGVETDCRIVLSVTGAGNATFHAGLLAPGTSLPTQAKDRGSQAFYEEEKNYVVRNVGGVPAIEIPEAHGMTGQLVVYTRRPFADMTADTDIIDDQYARLITAGTLRFLLEANKPGQDRVRLDRIMREESVVWTRLNKLVTDLPVVSPPRQFVVQGA